MAKYSMSCFNFFLLISILMIEDMKQCFVVRHSVISAVTRKKI